MWSDIAMSNIPNMMMSFPHDIIMSSMLCYAVVEGVSPAGQPARTEQAGVYKIGVSPTILVN